MTRNDLIFLCLSGLILALYTLILSFNALTHHYTVVCYATVLFQQPALLCCFVLYIFGFILHQRYPKISFIFKTFGMLYLMVLVMLFATTAISTTPFPLKNQWLNQVDHWVGFNLASFLTDMHHHERLHHIFALFYLFLYTAVRLVPFLLAALEEEVQVYRFFVSFLISCLLGFAIYYFWPSSDPSSVVHSSWFTAAQYHLTTQFNQMHHYQPSGFYDPGLIGFPSYHTIWAILLAYACWPRKVLFYPVALFSTLVIIAALASGWHFLTDIMGGVLVATLSIYLTHLLIHRHAVPTVQYPVKKKQSFLPLN